MPAWWRGRVGALVSSSSTSNEIYLLYQLDPEGVYAEDNLKLAVRYSPDARDRQVQWANFYEAGLLTGNPEEVGFESVYVDSLMHRS